jgi:pimeloyl-ACP methyl ester carboxylesterase
VCALALAKERTMRRIIIAVIAVIAVVLAAQHTSALPAVARAQGTRSSTSAAELPATPVGDQLAWLIGVLSGGVRPTEEDVASHFTPAALAELPPQLVIGLAQQFAGAFGPFTYRGPARPASPNQIIGYLTGRDDVAFLVVLATEAAPPHQLTGAALLPVPPLAELPPVSPESLTGQFDVGGRTLFLSCSGTGSPTVVLEAGYGDSGGLWAPVQNGVAPHTRVCSYDRPNVSAGASGPAPTPRTAADQVADLHALLATADVPGPYVLGAHSYGGLISRLYAVTYPDEVVGMVLVDTVHEDRAAQRQVMVSPEQWAALQTLEAQFSDFERVDEEASWEQVREAGDFSPLRPMPLVVLAAGQSTDPSFLPPDWPLAEEEELHREQQMDLAARVPGSRYQLVEASGHYIQLEQPALVIDAIADVIEAVRDPSRWDTPAAATPTSGVARTSGFDDVIQVGIDQGLTDVALAVDQDDQVRFDGVTGLATGEAQTSLALADRFRIYSITKAFTAVLVLQLVDEGVLSLDDTVAKWLDDQPVPLIPNVEQITLRQLLTHTSDVYDYFAEDSPFWQDAYLESAS